MDNLDKRRRMDKLFHGIIFACTFFGILILAVLLFTIFKDGIQWINLSFFTSFASRFAAKSGILAPLMGSLWVITLTTLFAFPTGVGAAIYLEEYAPQNRLTSLIQLNISNLAGVPSIVYGILGLAIFVNYMGFGRSILSGALTLALLILPVIIVSSQEALKSVPMELRQGAFALGASKLQMVTHVVLPYAMPGILTGAILAIARALGETAPLLMVGAVTFIAFTPSSIMDAFTTLPMQIYAWSGKPQADFHSLAAAGIIVLLVVLLLANALAIVLRNKYQNRV
jgi:phosphate transport system permease protein